MAKTKPNQHKKRTTSANKASQLEEAIGNDDGRSFENASDQSHKTTICYNSACPDYRRERHGEPCGCTRRGR